MKSADIEGVFEKNGKIFTENLKCCKGTKAYNEKLIFYNNKDCHERTMWGICNLRVNCILTKGGKKGKDLSMR